MGICFIQYLTPVLLAPLVYNAGNSYVIINFINDRWRNKNMVTGIIGMIIGILVLVAGIYYMVKEKEDPESKKIYLIVSLIGAVIVVVAAIILFTHL